MKRLTGLAFALAFLTAAEVRAGSILPAIGSAGVQNGIVSKHFVEIEPGVFVAVKGSRERRQVRYRRLVAGWSADQKAVAEASGFPVMRWRDLTAGVTTEIWSYPEQNRQFVFDAAGVLVETRLR